MTRLRPPPFISGKRGADNLAYFASTNNLASASIFRQCGSSASTSASIVASAKRSSALVFIAASVNASAEGIRAVTWAAQLSSAKALDAVVASTAAQAIKRRFDRVFVIFFITFNRLSSARCVDENGKLGPRAAPIPYPKALGYDLHLQQNLADAAILAAGAVHPWLALARLDAPFGNSQHPKHCQENSPANADIHCRCQNLRPASGSLTHPCPPS